MNDTNLDPSRRQRLVQASECLEQFRLTPPSPERQAEINRAAEVQRRAQHIAKVAVLRDRALGPKRHMATDPEHVGLWGDATSKVIGKLGSGFLIALVGGRGPGKTQIGAEAIKAITNDLGTALYCTATKFFMELKSTYGGKGAGEEGVIREYVKPSLLVMDEISRRVESDWEDRLLFETLDRRYRDMKDTLLLSNQSREDFVKSIGASLASRMQETGGILECNWPSFRDTDKSHVEAEKSS